MNVNLIKPFNPEELNGNHTDILDYLPPYKAYYARGIGIIRKEMYNGDVWTLEEYFINN